MKATDSDSGIKEASAAADVKGQMEPTPRPWIICRYACGNPYIFGPEGYKDDTPPEGMLGRRMIASVCWPWNTINTPETLANAELICRAVNNFDALVEALENAQAWLANSIPIKQPTSVYPLPLISEVLAKARGAALVPNGNDSSSASFSPKSTAAVTPTKGTN